MLCVSGGLAGAASRITGAMAKGVAAMTMDEEYQQKRREAMNKQPSGLKEGLTRGGKGLISVRQHIRNHRKITNTRVVYRFAGRNVIPGGPHIRIL